MTTRTAAATASVGRADKASEWDKLAARYTAASSAAATANSTAGAAAAWLPLSCGAAFGGGAAFDGGALVTPKTASALSRSVAERGGAGATAGARGLCCISWLSMAPVAVPFSAAAAAASKSGPVGSVHASMLARFGTDGSTGITSGTKQDWMSACAFAQYKRGIPSAWHRAWGFKQEGCAPLKR